MALVRLLHPALLMAQRSPTSAHGQANGSVVPAGAAVYGQIVECEALAQLQVSWACLS